MRRCCRSYAESICGRFTNTLGPEEIGETFGAALGVRIRDTAGTGRYKIFPSEKVLSIVRPDGERDAEVRLLRWGLIPPWAKDTKFGNQLINAKAETLQSKGDYYGVAAESAQRALIVADGFYDWQRAEDRKEKSQPYRFTIDDGRMFAFGGLWTTNHRLGMDPLESCTLLTCSANPVVRAIHDRMPVVLADDEALRAWLSPDITAGEALSLCTPFPVERMSVAPVSDGINKPGGIDGPELFELPSSVEAEEQLSLG